MARLIIHNPLLTGVRGRIGNYIIRQTKKGPIICSLPHRPNYKPNAQQKRHNEKFARAAAYASAVNRDPILRERWKSVLKKDESVYHAALKEYMRKPEQDIKE